MAYNTWVAMSGACCLGVLCGLIGSLMLLRKRALVGDVMAHSSLPGLVILFALTGSRSLPVLLFGAFCSSCLGGAALAWIQKYTLTKQDAGMGVVLSVFFGFGIALIRWVQNVMPGSEKGGLESYIFGKAAGILLSDTYLLMSIGIITLGVVIVGTRLIKVFLFDSQYAHSLGVSTVWVDFFLSGLLALALVLGLPMVGIVLVSALCVLPGVCARFWSEHYPVFISLAALIGGGGACIGVWASSLIPQAPTGPCMILVLGFILLFSILFAPQKGLISVSRRNRLAGYQFIWEGLQSIWPSEYTYPETLEWLGSKGVAHPKRFLKWAKRVQKLDFFRNIDLKI